MTGFAQDDTGVDVELSDGNSLRAEYLVGCDGGRSLIRKAAGIEFPGWDPTTSWLIAEVETSEEPEWGFRHDAFGTHAIGKLEDGRRMRVVLNTMAQMALRRPDDRTKALGDYVSELLSMDESRRRLAAEMSGLDIHYDLGEGHPLLGRRMPDLDLVTASGPLRVFTLLHDARPALLNLGEPGSFDITPWADRVQLIDAEYSGIWELPALGAVTAPTAVLIRPDGYVAWVGDLIQAGLADALTTWFGPPTAV